MNILFCRVGWMANYCGDIKNDPLKNGGSYNKTKTGHEIYNFKNFNNKYYGYVEPKGTIHIDRINKSTTEEYINNVLVVWIATNPIKGGQYIVGWYKNAKVYKNVQYLKESNELKKRIEEGFKDFNIESEYAFLLSESKRNKKIEGIGQSNIWYGNEDIKKEVLEYIENEEKNKNEIIKEITREVLKGKEKEAIVKIRENQGTFRELLLKKFNHKCALCGITLDELLIASHIKPWSVSNDIEKLNENNGLLLCATHDKLFDRGLISFNEKGKILISPKIDKTNQVFSNLNFEMNILVTEQNAIFIKYHRENIYI